jgi:hypothetical protein
MPKLRPEKVYGIVALSYLVLIPVGAAIAWRKLTIVDQDVTAMWEQLNMPERTNPTPLIHTNGLRRFLGV